MRLGSFLFVPGDSEKNLAKGEQSGADVLILDLEDAVAPERKPLARQMVSSYLRGNRGILGSQLGVRVNALSSGAVLDGLILDIPHLKQARNLSAQAGQDGQN